MRAEQADRFARGIHLKLLALAMALLAATLGGVGAAALWSYEGALAPAIEAKADTLGRTSAQAVERALGLGLPLEEMRGVEEFLAEQREGHPEVVYLAVSDAAGAPLFSVGAAPVGQGAAEGVIDHARALRAPSAQGPQVVGALHVGVDADYVRTALSDILFDIAVVIFAALLITFELLLYLVTVALSGPVRQASRVIAGVSDGDLTLRPARGGRDEVGRTLARLDQVLEAVNARFAALRARAQAGEAEAAAAVARLRGRYRYAADRRDGAERVETDPIASIRTPLFLFIFAESLSISFLPIFVDSLYQPDGPLGAIGREAAIGLPIALFMLIWAVSQPLAGFYSEGAGRARTFVLGATLAAGGLAASAFAPDLTTLILCRLVTAFGYGAAYIAAQGYVVDNTTAANRTQGFNVFVVGFFSATICGSAIGAILADRLGYRPTFLFAAVLALAAVVFVAKLVRDRRPPSDRPRTRLRLADIRAVFANPRFLALTLFAAIPAKFVLAAYIYYLAPLHLNALGESQSAIGRILMLYAVLMVFLSPWTAKLSDRIGRPLPFVALGTALSGAALLIALGVQGTAGVAASILVLGLGHAISVSTLATMVPLAAEAECERLGRGAVMGIYRLVERFGSVAGPFVAGALLAAGGYDMSAAAMGLGLTACAAALALVFLATRGRAGGDSRAA
ncbi:MAG: MFS transporter [Marivibrio sp.]|uniref:MFS transporter n=1 Tax=Marivibrio sp. TaxID=2039719 RepID=UPI0032F07CB4